MSTFIVFTILGLGIGAMYALPAIGVVLVFRSSGVVNISAGSAGMIGAFAWWEVAGHRGVPMVLAILAGVGSSAVVGALTFLLAIRPLARASTLAKIVSTLGVLIALQAAANIRFGTQPKTTQGILTTSTVVVGGLRVPVNDLWLIGISLVVISATWAFYRWSTFGLATSALAQSPIGLASLGYRTDIVGCINWTLGGALAGISGVFLASLAPISPALGTSIIVPVLASAVVGGMRSFPLAGLGAMAIGAIQSDLGNYVKTPGIADTVPLAVVAILLMVRGRHLPLRNFVTERLPRVQRASLPLGWIASVTLLVSLIVDLWLPTGWVLATTTTCCAGIVLLSVVVVTGYGGQISLAQFALAGVGALVAAHALSAHIPLLISLLLSVGAVLPISLVVGLPASRSRGMSLAIATLCLAQVIVSVLLNNTSLIGGYDGISIGKLELFGLNITPTIYPRRFSVFVIVMLALVSIVVCNLRRGRIGRQLLAVRANERAAASTGINVVTTKLGAFAYGGGIAALGGALMVLQNPVATFANFDVFSSIQYVAWAVIGGVGYVAGSLLGAGFQQGSIGSYAFNTIFGSSYFDWISLVAGVLLVVNLVQSADGLVPLNVALARAIRNRIPYGHDGEGEKSPKPLARRAESEAGNISAERPEAVELSAGSTGEGTGGHTLEVKDLGVSLGGVRALDSVSFQLRSGEVLGVIGPNGAGKTTLIDAITGFVKANSGRVALDGREITAWTARRRARAGVSRSFQSLELFDQLTIRENLLAAAVRGHAIDWLKDPLWPARARLSASTERVIGILSLEESLERLPDELSFGARRAVAVARSIAAAPIVVLLDEPAAGLTQIERDHLGAIVRWLAEQLNVAVLLVEHDVALVARVSDRVLALDRGITVTTGPPADVLGDAKVIESYIGAEIEPRMAPVQ